VITLTANADTGSAFRGWSGATCSGTADCVVTISAAETVTATFNLRHQLTVNKDGTGSGTVTSNPVGIDCGATCANDFDANTVVTLTAHADTGSTFTGWTGATCSGTGDCPVTMTAAETVTATFTLNQYQLSVTKTGTGTVNSNPAGIDCGATCDHDYDYLTIITLTANPASGWSFFGWEGDLSGNANPITITMDGNKSVTAIFKQYYVYLPVVRRDPIFVDHFDYTDSSQALVNWEIVPEPSATWFVLDGQYHGKHTVVDRNAKAVAKVYPPVMPSSYSVEAKVQLASGSDDGSRGGLLFDYLSGTMNYRFVIIPWATTDTNWLVQKRLPPPLDRWEPIANGLDVVNIHPGTAVNLLRVERVGTQIRVYANDILLWSGNDSSYTNGRAGFNIGTPVDLASGEFVEVIFDDFIIGSLP
jgi:Divergent InlB B-repeat domain